MGNYAVLNATISYFRTLRIRNALNLILLDYKNNNALQMYVKKMYIECVFVDIYRPYKMLK